MRRLALLVGKTATDNGEWMFAEDLQSMSVVVTGITTATVKVCASNAIAKPLNTAHEAQVGSDVTADGTVEIKAPYRWVKAYISAYTTGTINAYALGVQGVDVGMEVIDH